MTDLLGRLTFALSLFATLLASIFFPRLEIRIGRNATSQFAPPLHKVVGLLDFVHQGLGPSRVPQLRVLTFVDVRRQMTSKGRERRGVFQRPLRRQQPLASIHCHLVYLG